GLFCTCVHQQARLSSLQVAPLSLTTTLVMIAICNHDSWSYLTLPNRPTSNHQFECIRAKINTKHLRK
ncbi:hypothetical protein AB4171_21085, partial [Vibrio sp. 10N.286.51.A4]|uniref:hypothetical protein n=1 Tax=Vibrio sp. 10N.286.51.A4 TaxID=3229705 RepID=UPI0035514CD7